MQDELSRLSATELVARTRARSLSVAEMVGACLRQIERWEGKLHAWAYVDCDAALRQAEQLDRKVQQGVGIGPLCGVPVGVKDIFNTADIPTQMGSPIWKGFTPGNDARVIFSLRQAHGVIPGKTVTAEFAVHTPGPTVNPHHMDYSPGTSSSGSAVAVAAGMVPIALGTQTAGSTIRPASYCGVFGFKPSFGVIPRTGMLKTTDSLDTVGLFARTVDDLELLFDVIRVRGADYPLVDAAFGDPAQRAQAGRPWRVGLIRGPKWNEAEPYAREALLSFARTLARDPEISVEEVTLPAIFETAHDVHTTIYDRALAYYFKGEFKKFEHLVSETMRAIIRRGSRLTVEDYMTALQRQDDLARTLDAVLQGVDVLLDFSTGGEALKGLDSVDRPDHCLIWTLCRVPTINLPVFRGPNQLPFGAQLFARRYGDYRLLQFARYLRSRDLVGDAAIPAALSEAVDRATTS